MSGWRKRQIQEKYMTAAYFEDHPTDPDKVIFRKPPLDQGPDYERGFVDGMLYQTQSSVYKAVNAMTRPTYYIPSKDQPTWPTWPALMRGVRVEGDTVVISVKGGNDAARELCGALIEEINK
jgi:hypothetical protein